MSFTAPLWLWAMGAGLIPIVIHLIFRRRFVIIEWAASRFLFRAFQHNRRRLVLEHLLLLILRVLMLLILALLFAGPLLEFGPSGNAGSGTTIIVLDNSFSMSARSGSDTLFEQALRAAVALSSRVREQGGRIAVYPLVGEQGGDHEMLESVRLHYGPVTAGPALARIAELAKAQPDTDLRVFVFTDMQRNTWGFDADTAAGVHLADLAAGGRLVFVPIIPEAGVTNLGITALTLSGRPPTAGTRAGVRAVLQNYASAPAAAAAVFRLNGEEVGRKETMILPGRESTVDLDILFRHPGFNTIEVALEDDGIAGDNQRFLAVPVRKTVEILAVNGETSIEAMGDETDYFRKAMNPAGAYTIADDITIQVTEVDEQVFEQKALNAYDAVLLANVARLREPRLQALRDFVADGGMLLISGGELLDRSFYNRSIFHPEQGLLPGRLGPLIDHRETAEGFTRLDIGHLPREGVLDFLKQFRAGAADKIHFHKQFRIADLPPAAAALNFTDGSPAVIMQQERGIVCFLNFTLDAAWTNFPGHPLYLPFMRELINYGVTRRHNRLGGICGDPVQAPIPADRARGGFNVDAPGGGGAAVAQFAGTAYTVAWPATGRPGFYRIAGEGFQAVYFRNHDADESNPVRSTAAELRETFSQSDLIFLAPDSQGRLAHARTERPLWQTLAAALLVMCVLESFVAFRQSR